MCFDASSTGLGLSSSSSVTIPAAPSFSRHQLRSAIRTWGRAHRKDTYPTYLDDATKEIAGKLVKASDPTYVQVRDRLQKLFEVSKLFTKDTNCGDLRVQVAPGAKL